MPLGIIVIFLSYFLELPGAFSGSILFFIFTGNWAKYHYFKKIKFPLNNLIFASFVSSLVFLCSIQFSNLRFDYYRFAGGDFSRRLKYHDALEFYIKAEKYAPEGQSRQHKIDKIRLILKEKY